MSEEKKTSSKTSKKRRKKNGRRNLIITIFVLVILAVCAALLFLGTGSISKKNAVTKYFKSYNTSASKHFKNACYPMIWQKKYKLENGMSLEDVVANSFASQQSSSKDSFFKTISIRSKESLDDETEQAFADGMQSIYGIKMKPSKMERVKVDFEMKMSDGQTDNGSSTLYLYKYHGKWYVLSDPILLVNLNLDER